MDDQQPVDAVVRQRQHPGVDKRDRAAVRFGPDPRALFAPASARSNASRVAKPVEVGRTIAERRHGQTGCARPTRADDPADQPPRQVAERRAVEVAQVLGVKGHRAWGRISSGEILDDLIGFRNPAWRFPLKARPRRVQLLSASDSSLRWMSESCLRSSSISSDEVAFLPVASALAKGAVKGEKTPSA